MSRTDSPYRRGSVVEMDPNRGRVRVVFPDRGAQSGWLEVLQQGTGQTQGYWMPDEGEVVVCLMDERDEAGCVLGSVYSGKNPPTNPSQGVRRVTFSSGAVVEFDAAANKLTVSGAGEMQIECSGTVKVTAAAIELDGPTKVGAGAGTPALETQTLARLTMVKNAIGAAVPTPNDGGAALKAQLVAALAGLDATGIGADSLTTD
jgi:phage baseplate assembly protein V